MSIKNIPKIGNPQNVTVKREIPGHNDDSGNWVEGGLATIATIAGANIQPKSGKEIATTSGTDYASNYTMFAGSDDITFVTGYTAILAKDIVIDAAGNQYKVVDPGNWGSCYQSDLKLEVAAG
jgi:hypothetical protein